MQHLTLLSRRRGGDRELDAATVDDRGTGDPEDREWVVSPAPAGHDELQVMALVRVDLPPAAGGVGQVGISRARMTCRR